MSLAAGTSPWPNSHEEVAVLLSGGVDSSVALNLLLEQGHKVRAFYLKIWLEDELAHLGECPWEEDLQFAQAVCDQARVPLEVVSLQREYWDLVVGYTVAEARAGRTPNPDIMCNNRIKFGMFFEYVGRHFKKVATGHYAVVAPGEGGGSGAEGEGGGEARLLRSPDPVKDQTYFLCGLSQAQLSRALFPVGALTKEEVRRQAERFNLPTKARPDSQGICFLGKLKFEDFLRAHLGEAPGPCVELETGAVIGRHRGLWFHTIGQRRGVGPVLHPTEIHRGPWFVARKDVPSNTLVVTNDYAAVNEARTQFRVEGLHWISPVAAAPVLSSGAELLVKTRHGPAIQRCLLRLERPEGAGEGGVEAGAGKGGGGAGEGLGTSATCTLLEGKDSGLAPGQFAAFYCDEVCLGSGVIAVA
ncbi:tRNA-specific 2-thiouridylase [Tribonema minus]|uniref:tRNA-5-taurinomethyluridine 2-sulfurtransferase n=1 Tax=Tribonema minus TaxID=303371 RepID=A0A835YKA8_9STRA|nr:tRNA-specific 2-thiouridylase [Tribonema minus]